jgi:hypothetical protein
MKGSLKSRCQILSKSVRLFEVKQADGQTCYSQPFSQAFPYFPLSCSQLKNGKYKPDAAMAQAKILLSGETRDRVIGAMEKCRNAADGRPSVTFQAITQFMGRGQSKSLRLGLLSSIFPYFTWKEKHTYGIACPSIGVCHLPTTSKNYPTIWRIYMQSVTVAFKTTLPL